MDKTAHVRVLTMVARGLNEGMSKEAGVNDLVDIAKKHISRNGLTYLGGATGAVLGSLSAIGGPWYRYLTSGGAGALVGAGIGHIGDRARNELSEANRQLSVDRDLLTNEADELRANNEQLKNKLADTESTARIMKALAAAFGADVGESTTVPLPLSHPGAQPNSY